VEATSFDVSSYGEFANYYDALSGDGSENIEIIRREVARWRPSARSLLELGCGTGSVLRGFTDFDTLSGLDLAAPMLTLARAKVPTANLILADMANFHLGERFDVVVCVFDTLNHLESFSQWRSLMECVSEHLVPGGLFIFDVNTLGRLESFVGEPPQVFRIEDATITMHATKLANNVTEWEIHIERGEDAELETVSELVRELGVELDLIRTALSADFEIVDEDDGTGQRPDDDSQRAHFVARRRR
jgi:SAM-dependent methyltransferase